MIREIGDQKESGHTSGSEHAEPVAGDQLLANEIEAADEENAARGVQSGVKMRKDAKQIHLLTSFPKPEQDK